MPLGLKWNQNSCAFDSALTILYSIWNENINLSEFNNIYLNELSKIFTTVKNNEYMFDNARNIFRLMLHNYNPQLFTFGAYIASTQLFDTILNSNFIISNIKHQCMNNHLLLNHTFKSALLHAGLHSYKSIQNWISDFNILSRSCPTCNGGVYSLIQFQYLPDIIAFEFGNNILSINHNLIINKKT